MSGIEERIRDVLEGGRGSVAAQVEEIAGLFQQSRKEERAHAARVVMEWRGPPSRQGMSRAVLEDGRDSPQDPELARQFAAVDGFAALMKARLLENREKGDWGGDRQDFLLARLLEEAGELARAVRAAHSGEAAGRWPDLASAAQAVSAAIAEEAADASNFAMMVADVCSANRSAG